MTFKDFLENDIPDQEVLGMIQASPNMAQNTSANYDWDRYQSRWGVNGGFRRAKIQTHNLIKLIQNGYCKLSKTSEDGIQSKMQGTLNPVIITRPRNEPFVLAVVDGSHSLMAAWNNKADTVDVIVSADAAQWLGSMLT